MKKYLAILVIAVFGMASVAWAGGGPGVAAAPYSGPSFGTLTNGKYCIYTTGTGVVCNSEGGAAFAGTESTTGSAGSVKSNATTGIMQITGPAAGSTRVVTIPDANVTIPAAPVGSSGSKTEGMQTCWDANGLAINCGVPITMTDANTNGLKKYDKTADTWENTTVTEKLASFAWDGGGSAVATASSKRCTVIPMAATVVGAYAMADASTTSHFHVYQDAFAAGARSTTVTGAVDIGATLGSLDTTLTGWDKSITAGDEICISVEANNNAKWLTVIVYGTLTP